MARLRSLLTAAAVVLVALVTIAPAARAASPSRPVLSVSGTDLIDASGGVSKVAQLRGVNRSGTEYACAADVGGAERGYAIFDGPTYDSVGDLRQPDSSLLAMRRWGVNAVRVPLSDACWNGTAPGLDSAYTGEEYRRAVVRYVDQLAEHGLTAILSLHLASTPAGANLPASSSGALRLLPMPALEPAKDFWRSVVQRLGSALPKDPVTQQTVPRSNVVLDLYNEPHLEDLPAEDRWACWRDGCVVDPADGPAEVPIGAYETAGMADLVAAIRTQEQNTGQAARPLMLGGLDYANDLAGWKAHLPADTKHALVASFHVYRGTPTRAGTLCANAACWAETVGEIARTRPVVTGEVGQYDCRGDFVDTFADWADDRGVSYLAWTWNAMRRGDASGDPATTGTGWRCDDGPTVLKFNDGTPTDGFGLVYCQHLRARHAALGAGAAPALVPDGSPNPCPFGRLPTDPPADATPPKPPDPPVVVPPVETPPEPVVPDAVLPDPVVAPTVPVVPLAPDPAPTPRPVPPGEPRTAAVTAKILRLKGGKVALSVACANGATPCRGRVRVRTAKRVAVGRRRAVLVVLNAPYALRAGTTRKLMVTPTKDGRALLRRARRVAVVATSTSEGGLPRIRRLTLTR